MGRPIGAQNKDKPFRAALIRRLALAENNPDELDKIADALIHEAMAGDIAAISQIADRLDGKVPQAHVGDDEADPISMVHRLERVIVDVTNRDSKDIPPTS